MHQFRAAYDLADNTMAGGLNTVPGGTQVQKAIIPRAYEGMFKENDVAYLDGATPEGEKENGDNANYRLYPPRIQNLKIAIYFERLTGK